MRNAYMSGQHNVQSVFILLLLLLEINFILIATNTIQTLEHQLLRSANLPHLIIILSATPLKRNPINYNLPDTFLSAGSCNPHQLV
jgi:hypothetical protein